jgi:prepilin-type N-terminal cleavage/methylation domain-containing protein
MIRIPNPKRPFSAYYLPADNIGFTRYHFYRKSGAGFTLVEVLVSILVFSLALTAIFYILVTNISDADLIKNNFIASGLVQEGMEVVRNIRDNDWHTNNPFGTSIPDGTYRVQWNSQSLMPFADSYLKKDSGTGFFSYDTGADTVFKRTVTISTVVSNVEKKVIVSVTWNEKGKQKSVSAEDHLYNWK